MNGREFFVSAPGRIACVTGFVALAGPGVMALSGPGPNDIKHAACIVIACIVGCAAACLLSVYRFVVVSFAIAFFAPLIAGFYVAGLSFVASLGATFGWALLALALLPLATMMAAPFRSGERAPSRSQPRRVHAHA